MSKPRVGGIGVGHLGKQHARIYHELGALAAVVDADPVRAAEIAAPYSVPHYTDYRQLFGKVDAVSIAVPTIQHHEVAKEFLDFVTGAEILIHAYEAGDAPGAERAERLGVDYVVVPAAGISEDVALLLAYEKGAELIVAVGTHFNMIEFLERNRAGMSSTFLTRLRVGELLVDAKGVSRLVSRQVGVWPLIAFTAAGLGAIVVAVLASPALRNLLGLG